MKKGISKMTLIALVLLLVGLLVVWNILWQVQEVSQGFVNGGVCGASAALASAKVSTACGMLKATSPTALSCERKNIQVSQETITVAKGGVKEPLELPGYQEINSDMISTVVAEEMRECWQKFGKGELTLFPEISDSLIETITWSNTATACHICSEIVFSQDAPVGDVSVQQKLQQEMVGRSQSYKEFFNNEKAHCQSSLREQGNNCWDALEQTKFANNKIDTIDPEKVYAVVIGRQGYGWCTEDEVGSFTNFVYVIPHDELSTACNHIIS